MSAALPDGLVVERSEAGLYPVAFAIDSDFGRCVGVDLAAGLAADPASLTALLHPEERPLCRGLRGARLVEFAGGRIASRLAREGTPGADGPTLRGPGGGPTAEGGISISISHTRRFAVALASAESGRNIGVDIESLDDDSASPLLTERILSDKERAADSRDEPIPILQRLSLKEAAYKALFPRFGHIPLQQTSVLRADGAGPGFRVTTAAGHSPIAASSRELRQHVLSFARVG